MVQTFTVTTRARVPLEDLFAAALSVDSHVASMAATGERAIAGVTSGVMRLGDSVTWRGRHFGIWFTMTSRITHLDRPHVFVDEQQRGPFKHFRHVHRFEREGELVVMHDTVTVASPVFGAFAERLVLVPHLRRLIRDRGEHLAGSLTIRP